MASIIIFATRICATHSSGDSNLAKHWGPQLDNWHWIVYCYTSQGLNNVLLTLKGWKKLWFQVFRVGVETVNLIPLTLRYFPFIFLCQSVDTYKLFKPSQLTLLTLASFTASHRTRSRFISWKICSKKSWKIHSFLKTLDCLSHGGVLQSLFFFC